MIFSSNAAKSWFFPKKIALEYDLSSIIWKSGAFSPENMIFFFGREMKDDLSQERHRKWYFLYYMYKHYKYDITLLQKEPEMIFYKKKTKNKKTLKGDWHSRWHCRKSSNDFLCFHGDLRRRFYILLCSETKPGNLICRIEIWLLLQFIWLKIFYNEESSVPCIIQPSGVVFRGVLQRQLRKVIVH